MESVRFEVFQREVKKLKGKKQILVFGSLIMDISIRCDEIPKAGETVYTYEDYQVNPGGKGGNQAVAAARAGGSVTVLGRIADDEYAHILTDSFRADQIETGRLLTDPQARTGVAFVWVDQKGSNRCLCSLGANARNTPEDIRSYEPLFQEGDIVMTTLEHGEEVLDTVTELAKKKGCLLMVDPSSKDYSKLTDKIAGRIDILKPNEVETEILTGIHVENIEDAYRSVTILKERGIKTPIISLGKQGAVYESEGKLCHVKGIEVPSVDTTAAGDTFMGSLAARLSLGEPFPEAIAYANRAASLCVQKKGAQKSIPFMKDVL